MMESERKVPLQPRNDLCLCLLDQEKTKTNGGIFLPHGVKVSTATVLAVGPGAKTDRLPGCRMPMDIQVGAHVYLSGDRFLVMLEDGDDRMVLIPEQLILGVLPPVAFEAVP